MGNECGSDGTTCDDWWCCPYANWFCCPDYQCAATAANCPLEEKKTKLVKFLEEMSGWPVLTAGAAPGPMGSAARMTGVLLILLNALDQAVLVTGRKQCLAFCSRILFVEFLSYLEKQFSHEFKIKSNLWTIKLPATWLSSFLLLQNCLSLIVWLLSSWRVLSPASHEKNSIY